MTTTQKRHPGRGGASVAFHPTESELSMPSLPQQLNSYSPTSEDVDAVLQAVQAHGGERRNRRWEFYCPVHADRAGGNPSAWYNAEGRNVGTWGCQQGCHQDKGGGLLALAQLLDVELPSSTRRATPPPRTPSRAAAPRPTPPMMDQAKVDAALVRWLEDRGLQEAHLAPFGGRAEPHTWRTDKGETYTGPALILPTARWDDAARVRRLDPEAPPWVPKVKWGRTLEYATREEDQEGRGQEKRPGCLFGWEEALVRLHAQQEQGEQATLWLVNGHASTIGAHAAGLAAVALEAGEGRSSAADWWAKRLAQELLQTGLEEPLVLVAYDNDGTGREGAQAVLQALQKEAGGDGLLARVVDLSRHPAAAKKGGDVGDIVARVGLDGAAEALAELATRRWTLPPSWTFAEALGKPKPTRWLVEGMLPAGKTAVLYGTPGAGKSLVALDWAIRVAHQGPVLYIAGEGQDGLSGRLEAWRLAHPGHALPEGRLAFQDVAPNLLDPGHVAQLLTDAQQTKEELGDFLLIVVDTLARAMPGGDENATSSISTAIAALDALRRAAGGPTVLILHHPGKSDSGPRGSSSISGSVDVQLKLSATGLNEDGVMSLRSGDLITVRALKQKDGEPGRKVVYAYRVQELEEEGMKAACVVDSDKDPAIVARRGLQEQAALDSVSGLDWSAPLTFSQLRDAIMASGASRSTASNYRNSWIGQGLLAQDATGAYVQGGAWAEMLGEKANRAKVGPIGPNGPGTNRANRANNPIGLALGPVLDPVQEEEEQITLLLGQAPTYDRPRSAGLDCPACGAGAYPGGSCSNPNCANAAAPCVKCGNRHNPAGSCPPPTPKALGG